MAETKDQMFAKVGKQYLAMAISLRTGEPMEYYLFAPERYFQVKSMNSFFFGVDGKKNKNSRFIYRAIAVHEIETMAKSGCTNSINLLKIISENKPIVCKDLYDFYYKIKYEFYKRRYKYQ